MSGLTDAEVADLQGIAGHDRPVWPLNLRAEPHSVARFALGVGDDNPLWADPHGIGAVMPTFLYTGVNFGSYPDSGMPATPRGPTVTLWMRDNWSWHRSLVPGEAFAASSRITAVEERVRNGQRQGVVITETVTFTDDAARAIALLERSTITLPRQQATAERENRPSPTTAQLAELASAYDAEPGNRCGPAARYWDDLAIGDAGGTLVKGPLTVTNLVGFAMGWGAPLCPTNRVLRRWTSKPCQPTVNNLRTGWLEGPEGIHWDPDVYGAFGFDTGFDFGPQRISWVAHLCTDWCGDAGRLVALDTRLLRPNFIGDITRFSGRIVALEAQGPQHGEVVVAIEGENHLAELTTVATARIRLPRRGCPAN